MNSTFNLPVSKNAISLLNERMLIIQHVVADFTVDQRDWITVHLI